MLFRSNLFDEALIQAHSLKGTAGNISAGRLYLAAETFENALREKDSDRIETAFVTVTDELKLVLDSINRVTFNAVTMDEPQLPAQLNQTPPPFYPDKVLGLLPDLMDKLKAFDPVESEARLDEVLQHLGRQHDHELNLLAQELEEHVKNYRFDEAMEALETLEHQLKDMEAGMPELSAP